jgi:hypothetical protein
MDAYLTEQLGRAASIARQTASSDELPSAALRDRPAAVSISNLILPRCYAALDKAPLAALRITSTTRSGWASMMTWLLFASTVVAPNVNKAEANFLERRLAEERFAVAILDFMSPDAPSNGRDFRGALE